MARPRSPDMPQTLHVSMPATLIARLDQLTWNHTYNKPGYGLRSALVNDLIRKFLDDASVSIDLARSHLPRDSIVHDSLIDIIELTEEADKQFILTVL